MSSATGRIVVLQVKPAIVWFMENEFPARLPQKETTLFPIQSAYPHNLPGKAQTAQRLVQKHRYPGAHNPQLAIIEKERREKENEDAQKNEWEQVFILPACGRNFWHHVPSEPLYLLCSR